MSSKSDKPVPTSPPSWSIARRLALLSSLSAFSLLALSMGIMYWGLLISLHGKSGHYIHDEINIVSTILQTEDEEALVREIKLENEVLEHVRHYIRVLDLTNQTLIASPEMDVFLPASLFPPPQIAERQDYQAINKWQAPDGHIYQLHAVRVEMPDGRDRILHLAMDVSPREALLVAYRKKLLLVLVLGIVFSVLAGIFVTRRGLRPLEQINAATRRITASNLNERLHAENWPKELQNLAISFDQMLDRLQDSFNRLAHCSSNLAHELRTPINNLIGEAEVLLARPRSPEEYQKAIGSSLEEYARLSRVFESLLFLARAENGIASVAQTDIEVGLELEKICAYYEAVAEEAGVKIVYHGKALLRADRTLVRRAVTNLLANALKYTPAGGKVAINVRQGADGGTEICVTDSGCGIAAEHLPRLFDRFYRIDETHHRDPHGIGLGLSIVRSIMQLHGGTVSIQTQSGLGTAMTLHFPALTTS